MDSKEIKNVLDEMGISIKSKFIPFSKSRYKDDEILSLNWEITLLKNEKEILSSDYSMGTGHCPANKTNNKGSNLKEMIAKECEEGFETWYGNALYYVHVNKKKPIHPDMVNFVWCIFCDARYGTDNFEDFCSNFGYDTDSRRAEKMWKESVEIAAKFYSSFTTDEINKLEEIYQDY